MFLLRNPLSIVMAAAACLVLLRLILSFQSLLYLLIRWWKRADEWAQVYQRYEILRYTDGSAENPLYRKALAYVGSLPSLEDAAAVHVSSSASKANDFAFHLGPAQTAQDSFFGARITWTNAGGERLVIRIRRQDRTRVLRPYLQHVESVADEIELRRRDLRLFTNSSGRGWSSAPFTHPATLDTVAMDADLMARIRADLEAFLKGRAYYHRLGRVWRRSYLLYGPPGTGKSTFAAAMARFLSFDVYDLDLSREDDADLRDLLMRTTPKSLILIENLDLYLNNNSSSSSSNNARIKKLLDFMDGILSCCGEERVMVFTISGDSKDELDPAVLRPGRLDVHIHFPMCDFNAFKNLANSYLGVKEHKLYPQVEEGFYTGGRISQAEVGEIMIANKGSPSRAIKSVINALQQARFSTRREEEAVAINGGQGSLGFGKDLTPLKEFKKLYGFIKIKSGIKKDGMIPMEDGEQQQQLQHG
ncbi:AAA-ATPase At2g46620-like [Typha latifolia]|uniref:AAA-ATPase At2g46620-like n=1 Tax=Typha latifolia TaxID=4733 RepID=UPI003C3019A1